MFYWLLLLQLLKHGIKMWTSDEKTTSSTEATTSSYFTFCCFCSCQFWMEIKNLFVFILSWFLYALARFFLFLSSRFFLLVFCLLLRSIDPSMDSDSLQFNVCNSELTSPEWMKKIERSSSYFCGSFSTVISTVCASRCKQDKRILSVSLNHWKIKSISFDWFWSRLIFFCPAYASM